MQNGNIVLENSWHPCLYCFVVLTRFVENYFDNESYFIATNFESTKVQLLFSNFSRLPMASKEEIDNLEDHCAICWENLRSARKLPCGHFFHQYVYTYIIIDNI